tara:strand:- start:484 stop:741 length:258 start_codon:yes stop_codon:yes gene_type:complete
MRIGRIIKARGIGRIWKAKDISVWKDSQGFYDATHPSAGYLIDWEYFETRAAAIKEATARLKAQEFERFTTYELIKEERKRLSKA